MIICLPLNFSILLEDLLTSMVYMGVKVTAYNRIYGDSVKVGAIIGVPNLLTPPNQF
jgi:hypothetical protein